MSETLNILVIDDSRDDLILYRRALRGGDGRQYDIFEADNGEAGLEAIAAHNPDCILLDYSLPGRNGIEVLKRIRSRHPFVAVVIMTGQGNENVAVAAIKEGAQDYLAKSSITAESLQRVIRVAIEYCAMQKRIQAQQSSLEIFSRALAHDLKEPVNTMNSFLDLLIMHETLSGRGQGYLQYARKAATRMSALIDTVYFYTRLDGAPQEVNKASCDVSRILSDTKENLMSLILERKAVITCDALPDVHANRVQLTQVMQNLIANAINYCEANPVIHVRVDEEKDRWKFSITDNGPGIDRELQEKLFMPFKRLSGSRGKGLGLGLSICRKIIELHEGAIWYEHHPSGGTTFFFTLPRPGQAEEPERTAPLQSRQADPAAAGHSLATLLLVEDNEADVELARIMLMEEARLQCNLLVAGNGLAALELMRAQVKQSRPIDLVLLDVNMPGIDGFELLERMQADAALRRIPVVMCTTSSYSKDRERANALGARGYMTKPPELKKLKETLNAIQSIRLCQKNDGYALLRAA